MNREQISAGVRKLGSELRIGAKLLRVAAEAFDADEVGLGCQALKLGTDCFAERRTPLLALLNQTDPDDADTAKFHLMAGQVESAASALASFLIFAQRTRDGLEGDPARLKSNSFSLAFNAHYLTGEMMQFALSAKAEAHAA